jgi:hypothetical protein
VGSNPTGPATHLEKVKERIAIVSLLEASNRFRTVDSSLARGHGKMTEAKKTRGYPWSLGLAHNQGSNLSKVGLDGFVRSRETVRHVLARDLQ